MKLKRLSLFLALVMILSAFAGTFTFASAAEDANGAWEVNGKTYATLNDAFAARGSATTIYLIKDYAQSHSQVDINVDCTITIEGKGATQPVWSVAGSTRLLRLSSGKTAAPNVTVRNITMDDSQGKAKSVVQINKGTLTLDNVDVICKDTSSGAVLGCDGAININIINGSTITATGASAKTGTPDRGAIYIRGNQLNLKVENSTIDASTYCAAIYNAAGYAAASSIVLNNATIKATSGVTYAILTQSIPTLYKLGTTTITSGTTGETDAIKVLTKMEEAPKATTDEEADELARARGFYFRTNASGLAAIADANGDGAYYDGYCTSWGEGGTYYMINDFEVKSRILMIGTIVIDGQNKYKLTQTGTNYRMFDTGAANSNVTFRNVEINGKGNGIIATKQVGCTYTFENATVNYNGSYNLGTVLNCEYKNATLNVINSTINVTSIISAPIVYLHNGSGDNNGENTKINIVNSTIVRNVNGTKSMDAGNNVNDGAMVTNNARSYSLVIKDSVIDFSNAFIANSSTAETAQKTLYSRVIYKTSSPENSKLHIENSEIKKATAGSAPIVWYNVNTIHIYGENTVTGGDRMVEFADSGVNTLYYLGADKATHSINTENGAGIRTVKNSSGIRFISTIAANVMAGLKSSKTITYSFGTVIMKADDLKGTTVDAAIAAGKQYVDIPAVNGIIENEDGSVSIYAALVELKEKNYGVEFAGIAYIDITIQNGSETAAAITLRIYSDYNEEDNARSITEVAKKALADVKTTSSNELVDGFRYNNELAVGETYYVDGVAKVVAEGEKLYSAYNADQREVIAAYLA